MPRVKILIADDDPDVRSLYIAMIGDLYDVVVARDGIEAWKLFESERPRLVITDLNMPGINGLDLTEKIRNHDELGDTPVIILTGTTRNTDLPPGFWRIGTRANTFLEKPITGDNLVAEIRKQLLLRMQSGEPVSEG